MDGTEAFEEEEEEEAEGAEGEEADESGSTLSKKFRFDPVSPC